MKALILIGGLGTRLRPLTCNTPKPLLPIINKPFLEYQFYLLKKHNIEEVILCVSYLSSEFKNYFGNGKRWGIKIKYVNEKLPLGTGGAIRNAYKYIDEPTIILNGDILTDIDLTDMIKFHKNKRSNITIALTRVKDPTMYGLVETDKNRKIERFLEKPSWDEVTCNTINAGVYIFEPKMIEHIPEKIQFSVERDLFPNLLSKKMNLYGYIYSGYWIDIGTPEKYLKVHQDIIKGNISLPIQGRLFISNVRSGKNLKWGKDIEIQGSLICGSNVCIQDYVRINGAVCLGNNITVSKGSVLSDCVILDNTKIGEGARIEQSIIGKNCVIEANTTIGEKTVLGDNSLITKYSIS